MMLLETDDDAALAAASAAKGAGLAKPLHEAPWGTREFAPCHAQRHTLYVGQVVQP